MRILATSDVHSPHHLGEFKDSLANVSHVDVALLAGDMVDGGRVEYYRVILDLLKGKADSIIAVPGNEEYDEKLRGLRGLSGMILLNDEEVVVNGVRVIGSRGILDRPTKWQERNVKNIGEVYRRRGDWLISRLRGLRGAILLTHYSPTYATLEGEDEANYPFLGTRRLEDALSTARVLAIHGHAHRSRVRCVRLGESTVVNVAFEGAGSPFIIDYSNGAVDIIEPDEYRECREVKVEGKVKGARSMGLDEWLK